jgi:hypothetical protein
MKQTPLSSQPKEKKPTIQKRTPYERTEEKKESVMVTPAKIRETTAAPTPSTEEVKAMNFNKVREVAKQRHGITARSKNELISRLKGKLSATEWEKFKQEFKGELE